MALRTLVHAWIPPYSDKTKQQLLLTRDRTSARVIERGTHIKVMISEYLNDLVSQSVLIMEIYDFRLFTLNYSQAREGQSLWFIIVESWDMYVETLTICIIRSAPAITNFVTLGA